VVVATVAAVGWGYVYATMQQVTERMSPVAALTAYYAFGGLLLAPFAVARWSEIYAGVSADPRSFFLSASAVLVAEFAILWSVSLMGGVDAGLVEVSYPLWTMLFLFLILGERPSMASMAGGTLIMAGIIVIARWGGRA
jgi:drug/metabolite transporter (DMT)-like permease